MINLYETDRGDFAPAWALSPEEALSLHRRGVLVVADYNRLSNEAAFVVARAIEDRVRDQKRNRVVIFWGVKSPRVETITVTEQ